MIEPASTTTAPDFTVIGELSDAAIEALAALLIENYEREQAALVTTELSA